MDLSIPVDFNSMDREMDPDELKISWKPKYEEGDQPSFFLSSQIAVSDTGEVLGPHPDIAPYEADKSSKAAEQTWRKIIGKCLGKSMQPGLCIQDGDLPDPDTSYDATLLEAIHKRFGDTYIASKKAGMGPTQARSCWKQQIKTRKGLLKQCRLAKTRLKDSLTRKDKKFDHLACQR